MMTLRNGAETGEEKFVPVGTNPGKTVHMMSIHAEKSACSAPIVITPKIATARANLHGEVANAIEIRCKDCHGTADAYPNLIYVWPWRPAPAALILLALRNPRRQTLRFEWVNKEWPRCVLCSALLLTQSLEWEMSLVKDSVTMRAMRNTTPRRRAPKPYLLKHPHSGGMKWGPGVAKEEPRP